MDRLRLAVIDTGIDPSHPLVAPVIAGARLSMGGGGPTVGGSHHDEIGHGTACAGVASRGLLSRLELLSVCVADEDGASTVPLLEAGIAWAVEQGARVVNVSMGAPAFQEEARERMRAVCAEASRRGVVIVAAAGPEGTLALPAVLEEVVTVGSAVCPPDTLYVADDEGVDFLAKGDLQRVAWTDGKTVLGQGASLAAAHVTNSVCRVLLGDPGLDVAGVRAALARLAIAPEPASRGEHQRRLDTFYRSRSAARVSFLGRVAIYPFNKETHALVRYREELPFTLVAVADPPGKRLVGRDAAEVLGEPPAGLTILPALDQALEHADSVILGHLEAMAPGTSRGLLRELVKRAVDRGKGVYSFSRLRVGELSDVLAEAERRGVPCVDPTVSRADVAALFDRGHATVDNPLRDPRLGEHAPSYHRRLRSALRHDCPVLGVFGTSRAQGKLTLQVGLRAALTAKGYRVSHLATEPTGMLFGASATLPTGYERGNDLSPDETSYLAGLLATEIKNRERPDILLVGTQSGAIPLSPDFYRLGMASLGTLALGAATQPDACVLVANPGDPEAHVARCRGALESVLDCRVLAVALGDQVWQEREWKGVSRRRLVRLEPAAHAESLATWERRLRLPCVPVLGGAERLAEIVANHFATAGPAGAETL